MSRWIQPSLATAAIVPNVVQGIKPVDATGAFKMICNECGKEHASDDIELVFRRTILCPGNATSSRIAA